MGAERKAPGQEEERHWVCCPKFGQFHEGGFGAEIVTRVVPNFNVSEEEFADAAGFLVSISPDILWHVTAIHLDYKMVDRPSTAAVKLLRVMELGCSVDLLYVYARNLSGQVGGCENMYCFNCGRLLIEGSGFQVKRTAFRLRGTVPITAQTSQAYGAGDRRGLAEPNSRASLNTGGGLDSSPH